MTLAGVVFTTCIFRADLITFTSGSGVTMSAEDVTPRAASASAIFLVFGSEKLNPSSTLSSPPAALAEDGSDFDHLCPCKKDQEERNRARHCLEPEDGPLGRGGPKKTGHNHTGQEKDLDAET